MASSKETEPSDSTVPRRRRRTSGQGATPPPLDAPRTSNESTKSANIGDKPRRNWRPAFISSWGLSPTFRIYIFLGSILLIIIFLLFNESIIRQLREQERSRVDLYAFLYGLTAVVPNEQAAIIFEEVNLKRRDFPIVFTDHRGNFTNWKGVGLPEQGDTTAAAQAFLEEVKNGDTTSAAVQNLQSIVAKMDAQRAKKPFYLLPEAVGYIYRSGANFIIADGTDSLAQPLAWLGPDLPPTDATDSIAQVRQTLAALDPRAPHDKFTLPHTSFSYFYSDGANFVITTDIREDIIAWGGPQLPAPKDTTALAQVRQVLHRLESGGEPQRFKISQANYIHFGDSSLISRFSLAIFIQIAGVFLFAVLGYIGFRNIWRSEQRSVWAGMAKETAHQLGTPLSSLSGWLELMEEGVGNLAQKQQDGARVEQLGQMVAEMQHDMQRLNQIASRFSQIGSVPELEQGDVRLILTETINYFKTRRPQFGQHQIQVEYGEVPLIPLNAELAGWAFENLFKNAMDALDRPSGTIAIEVGLNRQMVRILFSDDGRGIHPENLNRIFEPGFSTKKRGWGLGLAFVKRIFEEYHKGKISIIRSAPGEGTTFEILLPAPPRAS